MKWLICESSVVTRVQHVVSVRHGDRTVLLDSRGGCFYGLDEVGGRIWELLQNGISFAQLVTSLREEYDAPGDVVERDTRDLLSHLLRAGLARQQA